MDYSSISHDPDHPAGGSPWSSSPQANRQAFSPAVGDQSSSPIAPSPSFHTSENPEQTHSPLGHHSKGLGVDQTSNVVETDHQVDHGPAESTVPSESPTDSVQRRGGQEQRQQPPRYNSASKVGSRQNVPQYKLQAKITGLERSGRKDPILRFDVQTNSPKFRTTQYRDIRRTHSEFIKLGDHLISACPECLVPAVPPPLTSAGAGTDEDENRVKASLQRWLNYVCSNGVLIRDEEMRFFVESDFGYSPVIRRKQPATGVRRKVIKQFAPPPDDTPELQNARPVVKLFYLGTMDAGHKVDRIVKARRGLGLAESDFGVKLGAMHVQEPQSGLSNAYRKLGKTIQTTGDYHAAQGTAEATTLGDPLQYHSEDAFIVKETLTNRHILLRELLQAQQTLKSKLNAADRLKASTSVKRDKVDEAISALEEAKSNEEHLSQKAQRVTSNLLQERQIWFTRTAADLRQSIREYVIREIEAERRTLATLEVVRPDIRAIDSSGGLSRLGREAHPAARRASLAASQGPKGDAWSGVPRRPDGLNRSISGSQGLSSVGEGEEDPSGEGASNTKSLSGSSLKGMKEEEEEEDEDRVDARNAASRLAASTFA